MSDLVKHTREKEPATVLPVERPSHEEPLGEGAIDIRQIFFVLWSRKYLIVFVVLLVFVPAATATFLADPTYQSTAVLQIDPAPTRVLPFTDLSDSPALSNYDLFMKTQDAILRTGTVLTRVVERLEKENRWPENLISELSETGIEVFRVSGTQLLNLSYAATDPEFAALVVNLYAEEFVKLHFEEKNQVAEKARSFLEERLAVLKDKIQRSEQELVEYARDKELLSFDNQKTTTTHQKFEFINRELAQADADLLSARAHYQRLSGTKIENMPESLKTPQIENLTSRLFALEQDFTDLTSKFGENWPAVVQTRRQISLAKEQLVEAKEAALDEAIEQAKLDYELAQERRNMFAEAYRTQQKSVTDLNRATIQYNILKRDVETNTQLYEGLLERLKQAGLTPGQDFGNIHLIETGQPSFVVYSPRVFRNLSIALLLGVFLGVVLAFLVDHFDSSIRSQEELEGLVGLPTLSVIPLIPELAERGRRRLNSESSVQLSIPGEQGTALTRSTSLGEFSVGAQESYRTLAASVLLSRAERPPQTIVVTSSVPQEGKSSLTANLGTTLAQSGASTVMVECDLRKPRLARQFGLFKTEGLTLYLSGGSLPDIVETGVENLHLVCSGPKPPNPVALLGSQRMMEFLALLAKRFQFILLDTPPVLTVSDARIIAGKVDGVIMVVRAAETPRQLVSRACEQLKSAGGVLLGTVLTGVERGLSSYSYGSYSGYYMDSSYYTDSSKETGNWSRFFTFRN